MFIGFYYLLANTCHCCPVMSITIGHKRHPADPAESAMCNGRYQTCSKPGDPAYAADVPCWTYIKMPKTALCYDLS
jgi:hypothetical protein